MLSRVTLDQLQMLIAVADTGSFSAAARKINRVQSAVSQAIQTLEESLELQLFDRSHKVPILTDAGRAIVVDARHTIASADSLRARARSIATVAEPEISVAIEQVFPTDVVIESLGALREKFPLVAVTLFAEGLGGPEQSLLEGNARLAIYSPAPEPIPGIQMEFVGDVPISAVAAASHPLAQINGLISQAETDEHVQLALTDRTKRYRGLVMGRKTWSFIDQYNRLDFALKGFGWCAMPTHLALPHLQSGALVELHFAVHQGRALSFPLYAAHRSEEPPGPAAQWLLRELQRRFSEWLVGQPASQSSDSSIQIRITAV